MGTCRPPKRRCETCRYWDEICDAGTLGRTGDCRRFSPVPNGGFDADGLPRFSQPETGVFATCGEWAKDDGKHRERYEEVGR